MLVVLAAEEGAVPEAVVLSVEAAVDCGAVVGCVGTTVVVCAVEDGITLSACSVTAVEGIVETGAVEGCAVGWVAVDEGAVVPLGWVAVEEVLAVGLVE